MNLTASVIKVIAEELGELHLSANRVSTIQPTQLLDDIGVNSMDRVCITCALDEEFGIEIGDEDAEGWASVADVVGTVEKLGAKVEGAAT